MSESGWLFTECRSEDAIWKWELDRGNVGVGGNGRLAVEACSGGWEWRLGRWVWGCDARVNCLN